MCFKRIIGARIGIAVKYFIRVTIIVVNLIVICFIIKQINPFVMVVITITRSIAMATKMNLYL